MQQLEGRNAFVTGGASGIGFAIARSLAARGVRVALADIDAAAAHRAAETIEAGGGRAFAVHCDVTSQTSLSDAADAVESALGEVRIVVNNAGGFTVGPLEQTQRSDWEWLLELNVVGVVNGLHTFLPRLRAQGGEAHILNTASVSGHLPVAGLSIYTASKFAVVGLTECLRLELANSPIGVSVLCPGIVRTSLLETSLRHRPERHGGAGQGGIELGQLIEGGSDPAELGERVADAIESGEFYVFTHPHMRPAFERRFAEIVASQSD